MERKVRKKPTVAQMVGALDCAKIVDEMLLEGASPGDVASFIHEDQQELLDVKTEALARVLSQRKTDLQAVARARTSKIVSGPEGQWAGVSEEDRADALEEVRDHLPSRLVTAAYRRGKSKMEELFDLEGTYLSHRARLDRMVMAEAETGVFSDSVGNAYMESVKMLEARGKLKKEMGLFDVDAGRDARVYDFSGYSEKTAAMLEDPATRRRLVSLLERMRGLGQLKLVDGGKGDGEEGDATAGDNLVRVASGESVGE
jgi:hypothetical protein